MICCRLPSKCETPPAGGAFFVSFSEERNADQFRPEGPKKFFTRKLLTGFSAITVETATSYVFHVEHCGTFECSGVLTLLGGARGVLAPPNIRILPYLEKWLWERLFRRRKFFLDSKYGLW